MKTLVRTHVVTAVLGWILIAIGTVIIIKEEGSLPAFLSLCLMGVVTVITVIDLLSVYLAKKQKEPVLPAISILFWGLALVIYGSSMFTNNEPWPGKVIYGVLILIALFKITASVSVFKLKPA